MSDKYIQSDKYKRDKVTLIKLTTDTLLITRRLECPELAPAILDILWKRRMKHEFNKNATDFEQLMAEYDE